MRSYFAKAEEYLSAAEHELEAGRAIAATSLAIHAGIDAADAVCGTRLGRRGGGQDHDEALALLRTAGPDGVAVATNLVPLLPMKTRAEYEPDEIPKSDAKKAVDSRSTGRGSGPARRRIRRSDLIGGRRPRHAKVVERGARAGARPDQP